MTSLTGLSPQNPNKYLGPNVYLPIIVTVPRSPTGADIKQPSTGRYYSFGTLWLTGKNPTTGLQGDLWYLSKIEANVAYWVLLAFGGAGDLIALTVDASTAPGTNPVLPSSGLISVTGSQVAAGTIGTNVIRTNSLAANEFDIQIQRSSVSAAPDVTLNGVAHFDSASFNIDSDGFVSLNGTGNIGITGIDVQANTAPGTDPVVPTAAGLMTVNGGAVANHSVVLESHSKAANTYNLEVQYATTAASTDATKSGVAHFDSAAFAVDANGFVSISSLRPNALVSISDDFIGSSPNSTLSQLNGSLSWYTAGLDWLQTSALGDSAHPGVLSNIALPSASHPLFLNRNVGGIAQQMILGGGIITLNFVVSVVALSAASPRYILRLGFGDTENADQANGAYFEYSDNINSGNWVYKTAAASSRTTTNSAVAVTTGYHNFQIVINAAASSIAFSVDGVSLGAAITTNIPTLAITPFVDIKQSVGTVAATSIKIDLMYMTQVLTVAR